MPTLLTNGGPVIWLIMFAAAIALAVFIERVLYCHRSQINSAEFLNGVRTVLKRDNVVEAISICDATPGPVARIVKTAILNRDRGRDRVREAVEEAGLTEVPRLEENLNLLATIAQIAPLLGLLGTIIGFMEIFSQMQEAGLYANIEQTFPRHLAGAHLRGGGHRRGHSRSRRLQLSRQPHQQNRPRHGTRRRRNRQHRHRERKRPFHIMTRMARIFTHDQSLDPFKKNTGANP
jgi:hypothetical protein